LPVSERTNIQVDVADYSWMSPYYSSKFFIKSSSPANWMTVLNKDLW
jgi:hypothetical protein